MSCPPAIRVRFEGCRPGPATFGPRKNREHPANGRLTLESALEDVQRWPPAPARRFRMTPCSMSGDPFALVSVSQSGRATLKITITAFSGFSGTVTLSASSPAGLRFSFQPASIDGAGSAVMTVTAAGVPAGTYIATITGVSGALSHSTRVIVMVTPGGSVPLRETPSRAR